MILVFDIDNTIYDFAASFAPTTRAFVHIVSQKTGLAETEVATILKEIFKERNTLDHQLPLQDFARKHQLTEDVYVSTLTALSVATRRVKQRRQVPYDGVVGTLERIRASDAKAVAFSNSPYFQLWNRLKQLRVTDYFDGVVSFEGAAVHEDDTKSKETHLGHLRRMRSKYEFCRLLSASELKPELTGFEAIQRYYGDDDFYMIGDSLKSDLRPASSLGYTTIWAKYGTELDRGDLETILEFTPWSKEKVESHQQENFVPDFAVNDLSELLDLLSLPGQADLFHDL